MLASVCWLITIKDAREQQEEIGRKIISNCRPGYISVGRRITLEERHCPWFFMPHPLTDCLSRSGQPTTCQGSCERGEERLNAVCK